MANVQVGKFHPKGYSDPKRGNVRYEASIAPVPNSVGWKLLEVELVMEAMATNAVPLPRIEGNVMVFDAPLILAEATATVIHRAVDKTNTKMAGLEEQRRKQREAQKQVEEKAAKELKDWEEKHKGGI